MALEGKQPPDFPPASSVNDSALVLVWQNGGYQAAQASQIGSTISGSGISFTVVNPADVVLDGVTDASQELQSSLDVLAADGGGILKLISQIGIYINSFVSVGTNTTLDLTECPVIYGPNASLGTSGDLRSLPASSSPILYADIAAGATTFDIIVKSHNITPLAGQQFILSGQTDVTGRSLNKETGFISTATDIGPVTGGERWTIVAVDPIQDDYQVTYPGDAYEQAGLGIDYSYFKISVFSKFTANVAIGDSSGTVLDASLFNIGEYVYIHDAETEGSTTGTGSNPIHTEINRIINISGNTLTFLNKLYNPYTTAYKGGVASMEPTINARVRRAYIRYGAADGSTKAYGLVMKYSVDSAIEDCELAFSRISGVNYGPYANGFRIQAALNCRISDSTYIGKPDVGIYDSGQGYAFVCAQGATNCLITGCTDYNARHGSLVQGGCGGNEYASHHCEGVRISAIDFHGVNARNNHIHDYVIVGGPLFAVGSTNKGAIRFGNTSHIYGDFYNVVENIEVWNWQYGDIANAGYGIDYLAPCGGNVVRNVYIYNCDYGIRHKYDTAHVTAPLVDSTIENVIIFNATSNAIWIEAGPNKLISGFLMKEIISDGCTGQAKIQNAGSVIFENCIIRNPVNTAAQYAIQFINVDNPQVIGCDFSGTNRGIYLSQTTGAQIIDNKFRNQLETRVFTDDTTTGNNNGYLWENNSYAGTAAPVFLLGASTGYIFRGRRGGIITVTGTSDTLSFADDGAEVQYTNAGAVAVTLPGTLPVGFGCRLVQMGAGQITLAAGSGATLRNSLSLTKTGHQYAVLHLRIVANTDGLSAVYVMDTADGA